MQAERAGVHLGRRIVPRRCIAASLGRWVAGSLWSLWSLSPVRRGTTETGMMRFTAGLGEQRMESGTMPTVLRGAETQTSRLVWDAGVYALVLKLNNLGRAEEPSCDSWAAAAAAARRLEMDAKNAELAVRECGASERLEVRVGEKKRRRRWMGRSSAVGTG